MANQWETDDDFYSDWLSLSEAGPEPLATPARKVSQHLRNARALDTTRKPIHKPSIYDDYFEKDDYDDDDVVEQCIPSRGRWLREGGLHKPGRAPSDDMTKIIRAQIREVSGLGYSNELIERLCRNAVEEPKEESSSDEKTKSPVKIVFQPKTSSSTSPKASSTLPKTSSVSLTENSSSRSCSPSTSSERSSSSVRRNLNGQVCYDSENRYLGAFYKAKFDNEGNKEIDINSRSEFPPLK